MEIIAQQLTVSRIEEMDEEFSSEEKQFLFSDEHYLGWIHIIQNRMLAHMKFINDKFESGIVDEDYYLFSYLEMKMSFLVSKIRAQYLNQKLEESK